MRIVVGFTVRSGLWGLLVGTVLGAAYGGTIAPSSAGLVFGGFWGFLLGGILGAIEGFLVGCLSVLLAPRIQDVDHRLRTLKRIAAAATGVGVPIGLSIIMGRTMWRWPSVIVFLSLPVAIALFATMLVASRIEPWYRRTVQRTGV